MNVKVRVSIMVDCPEWINELSVEDTSCVVDACQKKAEQAWNDKMDSLSKVYLANKAMEEQGQMSVFDYV